MRAYMESGFYVLYLILIIGCGCLICLTRPRRRHRVLFGLACVVLGCGDAFHLVPRAVGLFTGTLDAPSETLAMWLGIGKLITSVTMTVFYVLMYLFVFALIGRKRSKGLDAAVFGLTAARIVLCVLPQNGWLSNSSDLLWGVLRNIPFVLLGVLVIVLAFIHLRKRKPFKLLWLAIVLSFAFYIPVVLFASAASWVGALMLPKTVCYLWICFMGVRERKMNSKAVKS
ncbi:MAG: hypothetical protein ILO68_06070 [Clostridia bacterium]|nr:hypothetical protein [Clostridia bacterium]